MAALNTIRNLVSKSRFSSEPIGAAPARRRGCLELTTGQPFSVKQRDCGEEREE
jgi:hypothetical protein